MNSNNEQNFNEEVKEEQTAPRKRRGYSEQTLRIDPSVLDSLTTDVSLRKTVYSGEMIW